MAAWNACVKICPEQIIQRVSASELRGRGGAGFPTGRKWEIAASQPAAEKYLVANLDEGDPGAFIDRFIAEDDPFCLIEGMLIAARAIRANKGWIYVRFEYPQAFASLEHALKSAREAGLLGSNSGSDDRHFEIELVRARGGYICGEETALLNSIEGKRPVVRPRPPYTAIHGYGGYPTVVNNVETLANVPWIIRHGAKRYASVGIPGSRGTKAVSLNSLFRRPGLYEVEFGISLREIVENIGGGLRKGTLQGLMVGGPFSAIIPPHLLDTKLGFHEMNAIGGSVGHGGIIAFDETTSIPELVEHVLSFAAYESCGGCTPCRIGAARIAALLRLFREEGTRFKRHEWTSIIHALELASLCGLGTGVAEFARSLERHYAAELAPCFA
jgi:formate dehydrogenase iron-sulfur subunit